MLGSFSRASRSFSSNQCSRDAGADAVMKSVISAKSLIDTDYYPKVLVLYLERPAMQRCAGACSLAGRFGYSDLKEAAHMEAYVL